MNFPGYPPSAWPRILMEPSGLGTSGVLAMAEALGKHEEKERRPLVEWAEAGGVWERALIRAGVPREALTLTNLVWYRPPNNELAGKPWEMDAIRACAPLNEALVEKVRPRCILAVGGLAWRELSGLVGEKCGILQTRGFIVPGLWFQGIPVIGTYHPSLLRRGSKEKQKESPQAKTEAAGGGTQGMALLGAMIRDILRAVEVAAKGVPEFKHDPYVLGGTLDDWESFYLDARAHPDLVISYDWETPRSSRLLSEEELAAGEHTRDIIQGQMSLRPGQAIVSKFTPELLPLWRKILALPNPKLDWNGRKFDRPLAAEYGLVLAGDLHDGMDFWHHAQPDLPRGLQYATSFFCPEVGPWKHLIETDGLWYGALDVDMPLRIFYGLEKSLGRQRHPASRVSLLEGYRNQVLRLAPALDEMKVHGIPVREDKRLELDQEFTNTEAELLTKLQALAPEEIRNVEPKDGYKRKQKLPQACIEASGQGVLFGLGPPSEASKGARAGLSLLDLNGIPPESQGEPTRDSASRVVDPSSGVVYVVRTFEDPKLGEVKRWARLLPFKPSSQQVIRYLKWRGLEVPKDIKTGNDSSGELGLRKLLSKSHDPLLAMVLDYREVEKARSTYVEGWKPASDGRVHSTFGFKPASGQLSSEDPNAQNYPKHAQIARRMRRIIEARPGRRIVQFDWKSFHVLTLGFEAKDPLYMRMARLDMHSFFALVGLLKLEPPEKVLELPDPELKAKLAWYRKQPKTYPEYACQGHPGGMTFDEIRDERAKRTILGVGFGQSGPGMFRRNPESFANQKEASDCLEMLNRVFPKPQTWRKAVTLEADREHCLLTRHGFCRHFWDVLSRKRVAANYEPRRGQTVIKDSSGKRTLLIPGDDYEAAIAYRPANDAFGIKRSVMVDLFESGKAREYGLMLELHDDLDFECEESKLDLMIPEIKARMEAPCPLLLDSEVAPGGLWCEVEVKVGRNWDFQDADNPEGMAKVGGLG